MYGHQATDPDDYTRLFALAKRIYAGYGDYRAEIAAVGRQIPIFRLKPYERFSDRGARVMVE